MINGFDPIIGSNPKYLILGSAPSVSSLEKGQYYGNNRNSFWVIISSIFNGPKLNNYSNKIQFITDNNIILWDVIKNCEREGSLDSNIKNVEVNKIKDLFLKYKTIEKVVFNGKMAQGLYKKHINYYPTGIQFKSLPSSSPAYTMKTEDKIIKWKEFIIN